MAHQYIQGTIPTWLYQTLWKITHIFKTPLQPGIYEPVFYGDLVYKFKRISGKPNFSDQFNKIIKRYKIKKVGYNMDIIRQSVCLVEFSFN